MSEHGHCKGGENRYQLCFMRSPWYLRSTKSFVLNFNLPFGSGRHFHSSVSTNVRRCRNRYWFSIKQLWWGNGRGQTGGSYYMPEPSCFNGPGYVILQQKQPQSNQWDDSHLGLCLKHFWVEPKCFYQVFVSIPRFTNSKRHTTANRNIEINLRWKL